MPRKTYLRTDETFKVLTDHLQPVANEFECDLSYINKIKNGAERDPFAYFRPLFRAAANAGAPVHIWLNDLSAIYARSQRLNNTDADLSKRILEKIQSDSDALGAIFESVKDNELNKSECLLILSKIEKKRTGE